MSYSVCAYLTEADKVKSVYGTCDNQLINQLKVALKQELDTLNDYFSDSLNTDKDAYAALADIVNGEIRYPEIAFMYGYVYEKICNHYGTQIYCAENLWQLDSQSTFIPIPLSSDFPYTGMRTIPQDTVVQKEECWNSADEFRQAVFACKTFEEVADILMPEQKTSVWQRIEEYFLRAGFLMLAAMFLYHVVWRLIQKFWLWATG